MSSFAAITRLHVELERGLVVSLGFGELLRQTSCYETNTDTAAAFSETRKIHGFQEIRST